LPLTPFRFEPKVLPVESAHYVYIPRCRDGTYYHGYTKDTRKRLSQHRSGESHPTRRKLPVEVVYFETFRSKTESWIPIWGLA
jgi:putative endonuclease